MTVKEQIENITTIVNEFNQNRLLFNKLNDLGVSPESVIHTRINNLFVSLVSAISKITSIDYNSIEWFLFENDCGAKKFICSYKKKNYSISSIEDFVKFENLLVKKNGKSS